VAEGDVKKASVLLSAEDDDFLLRFSWKVLILSKLPFNSPFNEGKECKRGKSRRKE